ncbi:MAG: hypothetical protein JW894_00455 [Bacteroidales bacterium]|nr:hypothetical protein [Bacteroidales bacterium]
MEKKEKIEFVDSGLEKEEIKGFTFRGFIDGSILTLSSVMKQLPFILFLVFLAVVYIANRYHAEKIVRQITKMKDEVKDLRSEQITTASELMNLSKPSNVKLLIEQKGIDLEEPEDPPKVIVAKKKDR